MAIKFTPHDYQETTIDFLMTHDRGLVILDMGLGKTVSSLTAIKKSMFPSDGSEPRYKRPLIIAPKIVSENTWANELAKWEHLKNMRYIELDASRTDHRLEQFDRIKDGTLTIMSESKIQWLVDMLDRESLEDNGREWTWDAIFIDEISLFKSPKNKRFQNLRKKLQNRCKFVYGLTGTPAPNDLADLWAIMLLIDKGQRLGTTKTSFNKHYCKGIKIKVDGRNQEITNYKVAEESYNQLLEDIEDVCIAMKAKDYLKDMPDVTIEKHEVALPKETLELIDKITVERVLSLAERDKDSKVLRLEKRIERYRASGSIAKMKKIPRLVSKLHSLTGSDGDIVLRASHVFSLISIGRQLAGGAVYEAIPDTEDENEIAEFMKNRRVLTDNDTKLAKVAEIVRNANDNVLIFYHYKHEAERLQQMFKGAQIINTANARRVIPLWNSGKIKVLLANPASTKFGLNMQDGGHTIIWFGLDYSFEKYVQSNARLARQGQKQPVKIHIVCAENTIDVDIEKAVVTKSELNEFVYDQLGADKQGRALVKQAGQERISRATERATGRKVSFYAR